MRKKPTTLKTRLYRSTRAISAVLSVLLMIAIAVAAALVAYAWIMGYLGGTTQKTEYAIQIQSITNTPAPDNFLVIYVQNVGQGLVHLKQDDSVYVNGLIRTISQCPAGTPVGTGEILPIQIGETKTLVETNYKYFEGNYIKVKIVTTEGTFTEITIQGTKTAENPTQPGTTHTLTISTEGTGSVTKNPNKVTYQNLETVQLIASTQIGWEFNHWSGDYTGTINPLSIVMNSDKSVKATFTQKGYELIISKNGQGEITKTPDQANYHLNDQVQLTATPATNWEFAGWTGDATSKNPQITLTIDNNPQITATFTQTQYSLTATSNPTDGGTIARSKPEPYVSGDTVTLTATPLTGFTFADWSGDLTGLTNPATITITGNMIVTANFARIPVTLTLTSNPSNAGTIIPNATGQYYFGDVVQLTAAANGGYTFSSWDQDLTGPTNPTSITLNGNKAVTANFNQDEYTLQTSTVGSGSITKNPDHAAYHYGDQVQLTANPDQDWAFTGWTGDLTGTTNPASIIIIGNMAVSAEFEQTQTPVTLTLNVNPTGSGSITANPAAPYNYGDTVQLTPVPAQGYVFTSWTGDLVSSTEPATITLDGDKQVTANFEQVVINSPFEGQTWAVDFDYWPNPPWHRAQGEGYGGTDAASSTPSDDGFFSSDPMDMSNAVAIHISFYYKVQNTNSPNDLTLWYSGRPSASSSSLEGWTQVPQNGAIGNPGDGEWHQISFTIARNSNIPGDFVDSSAFTSTFRLRFYSILSTNPGGYAEQVWVDNVLVTVDSQ